MKQCGIVTEVWHVISEDIVSVFWTYTFLMHGVGLASGKALWRRDGMHAYASLQPQGTVADITNQTQMPSRCFPQHRAPGSTHSQKLWEDRVWLWSQANVVCNLVPK